MDNSDIALWKKRLSRRPNLLDSGRIYIPMLLGNIEAYTKLEDYAEERVKEIETIGVLEPVEPTTALLHSTTIDDPKCTLKLSIGHLSSDYAYPVGINGVRRGLRNAWETVKVFGTLAKSNNEIVLLVHIIVRVEDFKACEKTLAAVAEFARTKYSMYKYDPLTNDQLRNHIESTKKRPRRKVTCGKKSHRKLNVQG